MGNKFVSAAGDNPLLKARPPADRRGAQMKAPSERAPRGKYAGGVLEQVLLQSIGTFQKAFPGPGEQRKIAFF